MKKSKAFTLVELLVVISIISLLAGMTIPMISRARDLGKRAKCAAGMKAIHAAMLIYNGVYNYLPVAEPDGLGTSSVGTKVQEDCSASKDSSGNTRSLFLLCKVPQGPVVGGVAAASSTGDVFVGPEAFLCAGTTHKTSQDMDSFKDFDFRSYTNVSYSYQVQKRVGNNYYPLNTLVDGSLVILADRNAMCDEDADWTPVAADDPKQGGRATPAFERYTENSANHKRQGQNVLNLAGQVLFVDSPYVGRTNDNIWCPGSPVRTPSTPPTAIADAVPISDADSFLWP